MPGARCARSRACSVENTRVSHHGHTGSPGIPRAMVLTGSFVISPVTGLVCHRHLADKSTKLDASVGASGPHDFAVRLSAVRQRHRHVHRIPSRVRDDRETPLYRDGMARNMDLIWVKREGQYFYGRGWTANHRARSLICPSGKRHNDPESRVGWAKARMRCAHLFIRRARCALPTLRTTAHTDSKSVNKEGISNDISLANRLGKLAS
jgi:hypothetical protein